jgi:hypothetical protein
MEKRLIATMVAAAFAGTAGVAVAGPISVASIGTYASETIGAATGNIALGNVAYTLSNPFAIASTQTVKYALSSKMATCPALAIIDGITGVASTAVVSAPGAPGGTGTTTCSYTVTVGANAVPANSILNFTAAAADKTAGVPLAAGTPLAATVTVFDSTGTAVENNTASVAVSAHALSAKWVASAPAVAAGAFPTAEASKVNVAANPVGHTFTLDAADATPANANTIVLGAFQLVENAGTYLDSNGVAKVNLAALTTNKWTLAVTGPFTANANAGVVFASGTANCAVALAGAFTITAGTATGTLDGIALGLPAVSPQTAYVCYTPNAGLGVGKTLQIPTGQFTGTGTTAAATVVTPNAMVGESVSTTNLYNLASNGAQVDVRVMTTSGTTGWNTVLRIINTGAVAAPVTAQYLPADGSAGPAAAVIVTSLAAGATAMLSAAQIETALGVTLPSTGNPPRIRVSAPTDSLRVQAWVQTPNGAWFMGTPSQGSEAAGGNDPK